ncbi:MAG: hypothetical protein GY711_29220 [bacterium]|nr:hypothetical protein [bacterium]
MTVEIPNQPDPGPVLVFAPHPDDEVIGCGGVLALHAAQGDRVHVAVVFDGAAGDPTGTWEPEQLVRRRRDEALAGGRALAGTSLGLRYEFWGYPEGHEASEREIDDAAAHMVRAAGETGARTVYAPWAGDEHTDHRLVARALGRALASPDWPASVNFVWGFEVWTPLEPERVLDIGRVIENKRTALACHATQSADFELERGDALTHRALGLGAYRSQHIGRRARYAEAFCGFETQNADVSSPTTHGTADGAAA